jgi:hypothetical protein
MLLEFRKLSIGLIAGCGAAFQRVLADVLSADLNMVFVTSVRTRVSPARELQFFFIFCAHQHGIV